MSSQPGAALRRNRSLSRPFVIGLTGTIAAGKSTVAHLLAERGARVIDADLVYRSLLAPGSALSRAITDRFGAEVIADDGSIDRGALGKIVFADAASLADLDAITHPAVLTAIREAVTAAPEPVVVIEAIKLVSSGLHEDVDSLWEVSARKDVRLARLMDRSGLSEMEAEARIQAFPEPIAAGTPVQVRIDNSGSREQTARQVDRAWRSLGLEHVVSLRRNGVHEEIG